MTDPSSMPSRMRYRLMQPRTMTAAGMTLCMALLVGVAHGQDDPQFATWPKVEASDDAKKFIDQLKKGEFDAGSKNFLERVALPQLAAEGNRKQIERTRKRMRDVLLNDRTAEAAALEQATKAAADWLAAQSRNPQIEPVVRVNAMLMIGELRGKDGRLWSGSMLPLAAAMADPSVSAGVRVAAAAGLAKHVDASRGGTSPDPALVQAAAKPLAAVLAAPASAADGPAGDWLTSRALDMLAAVTPKATPDIATALQGILGDAGRAVDVRVRAAAALGSTAGPDSNVDAAAAIAAIQLLAVEALAEDIATAAERAMKARFSGQPPTPTGGRGIDGGPQPVFGGEFGPGGTLPAEEDPIDSLVVRRDAWRLMTLANAVASPDGKTGLAAIAAGEASGRGKALSQTLRESARALEQSPDAATMKQALTALERLGRSAPPPAGRSAPAAEREPAAEQPAKNDPFGAGN